MRAIVAPSYCDPSKYELSTISRPVIAEPNEVLIQVHAASVNPVDVKVASGLFKLAVKDEFPYKIGYDCSGVVVEVGSGVKRLKAGDEVYARLPERSKGSWSEYAKCDEFFVALKPRSLSFSDAAAIPLAAMTALQALKRYNGTLSGKTVFVPAGLGGSGSYACQLAKNVFGAGKVITTVSTSKVDKVHKLLGEGVVDQVIDYTKEDPTKVIPSGSVDFIFDTTGQAMQFLSLVTPKTGMIISVSTQPSGTQLQNSSFFQRPEKPQLPFLARMYLNIMDGVRKARAYRWSVHYDYLSLASNAEDLETLSEYIGERKVAPVVGSRTKIDDLDKVRKICMQVYKGKGGIGKAVIEVIDGS